MKRLLLIYIFIKQIILSAQGLKYPNIANTIVNDHYFDTTIVDEFRNLENLENPETQSWISQQNDLSRTYLKKYRTKDNTLIHIKELNDYSFSLPYKIGKKYYYIKDEVLYSYDDYSNSYDNTKLVADLSKLSRQKTNTTYYPSPDNKYVALLYSENNSDWHQVKITRSNGKYLNDHLFDLKFSQLEWKDDGFFYIRYLKRNPFSTDTLPNLMYHQLGTSQEVDLLIDAFDPSFSPYFSFDVSSDYGHLFIHKKHLSGESNSVFHIDLNLKPWQLKPFIPTLNTSLKILDTRGMYLLAMQTKINENGNIVKIPIDTPNKIIQLTAPLKDAFITEAKIFKKNIICLAQQGPSNFFVIYDTLGNLIKTISTEQGFSIGSFNGNWNDDEIFYYIETYFHPPIVYKLNLQTYEVAQFDETRVNFNPTDYTSRVQFYPSKDGTMIPINIVFRKDLQLEGNHPTLLKTYGGFGAIERPSFDPGLVYFLQQGGIFAYAHVRGEGTYGSQWAEMGQRLNKHNSIDDFIAAAEYLINEKYTSASRLAAIGGSHGGLIVAAAMVQRPDLFKLVIPKVAALDMLRLEKFTIGIFNISEFGSVKNKIDFLNLLSYSPIHQIKSNINYPTCLVMTSLNDERVPPFHSFRFVAKLQSRPLQTNPILLRVSGLSGHSVGDLEEAASDIFATILQILKD